jgi:hypothetical protein
MKTITIWQETIDELRDGSVWLGRRKDAENSI